MQTESQRRRVFQGAQRAWDNMAPEDDDTECAECGALLDAWDVHANDNGEDICTDCYMKSRE